MAKIGILADNYKVEMFKKELTAAGIHFYIDEKVSTEHFTSFVCISEQHIVKPIVDKVTQFFINHYKQTKNN